jgi:general secretion pathway protein I
LSRATRSEWRGSAGFTLIEVLVALAVVAASLAAIGTLIATSVRGVRAVEQHVTLVERARAIMAELPRRDELSIGEATGEIAGHRWRIAVLPHPTGLVDRPTSKWVPRTVVATIRSPSGRVLQVHTVRLVRRPSE